VVLGGIRPGLVGHDVSGGGSPGKGEEPLVARDQAESRASAFQAGAMSRGAGDPAAEGWDTVINAERQQMVAR
jgi:hypothetical protein